MGNMTLFIAGIAILSLGTYLMRLGGAKLGNRLAFSERSQALLSDAATVLLFRRPCHHFLRGRTFRRYGARSGRCFRCVPRLAQGPADRRDYRRRRGDRAAAPDGYKLKKRPEALFRQLLYAYLFSSAVICTRLPVNASVIL